jgi:hypothetical protein
MPARLNLKTNGKILWPKLRPEYGNDRSRRGNAGPWKEWEKQSNCFSHSSHRPWKSIKPISTLPRHDYDEDEYILKPAGLRDTHSEGKVTRQPQTRVIIHFMDVGRIAKLKRQIDLLEEDAVRLRYLISSQFVIDKVKAQAGIDLALVLENLKHAKKELNRLEKK